VTLQSLIGLDWTQLDCVPVYPPLYNISWDANGYSAYQHLPQNFMELMFHYTVHENVIQCCPEARLVKINPDTVP